MTTQTTPARAANALPGQGMRVALFVTCMNDVMFPGTGRATVKLLERLGCTVEFPREQTCCAQITTNTGYFDELRRPCAATSKPSPTTTTWSVRRAPAPPPCATSTR